VLRCKRISDVPLVSAVETAEGSKTESVADVTPASGFAPSSALRRSRKFISEPDPALSTISALAEAKTSLRKRILIKSSKVIIKR
jgi:hypothetical protein